MKNQIKDYTKVDRNDSGKTERLYVYEVIWDGPHTPVGKWTLYQEYQPPITDNQLRVEIKKLLDDKKYFDDCDCCEERKLRGNMNGDTCHACMEKQGCVF